MMQLSTQKAQIRKELITSLQLLALHQDPKEKHLQKHYEQFTESLFGGKMIRGLLVCIGYMMSGRKIDAKIIQVASAFEIVHAALLIHDDIIDQSNLRRGKPSLHVSLGNNKKGESLALCFGDLGLIWSTQIINDSRFPNIRKQKAVSYFCEKIKQTIYGQLLDVELSNTLQRNEKEILKIYELKTAAYSFSAPLGIGAICGGYSTSKIATIEAFGREIGIAFQIQDDMLGIFGNENTIGKSITSDIAEGKNTLLISFAMRHATKLQQILLKKYYGNPNVTPSNCEEIKKIFIEIGAFDYCTKITCDKLKKAQKIIPQLTTNRKAIMLLQELVNTLAKRSY